MLVALVLLTVLHPFAHHGSTYADSFAQVGDHDASLRDCPCVHASADVAVAPLQPVSPTVIAEDLDALPKLVPLEIAQGSVPARAPPVT